MTYKSALTHLGKGFYQLGRCLLHTSATAIKDVALVLVKHPILAFVLILIYVCMFIGMTQAKQERDRLSSLCYKYEVSNDSLKILIDQ